MTGFSEQLRPSERDGAAGWARITVPDGETVHKKPDRRRIIEEIEKQLSHQPAVETENRKRLRPNQLAEWELRIDRFRIFYDTNEEERLIKIEAVGYKRGSRLFLHGSEYRL